MESNLNLTFLFCFVGVWKWGRGCRLLLHGEVWQPWLPRDRCTALSTKWERRERRRDPTDMLKDPSPVGPSYTVLLVPGTLPASSGTVCSPISQWDLGNNWKPQVPRIWALLLPVHVKIVVLLQAHCGPSKPTQSSAARPDRTLSVHFACIVKVFCHHHHHYVHEGLVVFPVPWSSKWNWSLHLFLGRPMFLRPFGLYCSACFVILFVSILCMCCSHFSWYCFISFTIFSAPVFSLIHWFFSLGCNIILLIISATSQFSEKKHWA